MAIAHVQTAKSIISNQSNVTVVWSTAPTVGNLILAGVMYDADRTLILPPDETDGWTAGRVAEVTVGSDTGGRVVRIDTAIVGSGTDTDWFWDINPNDILGVVVVEVSGADIDGTLKKQGVNDSSSPYSIFIDGTDDPAGEMYYFIFAGSKSFGSQLIVWSNTDSSMTDLGGDETEGGTNFAMNAWYEILDGARPTATLTIDDGGTGGAVLLGVPVASGGAQTIAVGTLPGSDLLIPIAVLKPILVDIGTIAEINGLVPAPAVKEAPIGTLSQVDSLRPIAAVKPIFKPVGTMTESGLLIPVGADKPIITGVGTLAGADTLLPIAPDKPIVTDVGTLAQLDTLLPVAADKPIIQGVGTLGETDSLLPVAVEQPVGQDISVGTMAQLDTLLPVAADKPIFKSVGTLGELDTLLPVAADKPIITGVGTLAGADTLLPVPADKVAPIGTLAGADTLLPVAADKPIFKSVGTIVEADTLILITAPNPPQFLVPIADVDVSLWFTVPLWSKIDEGAGGTGDGITIRSSTVGNNSNTADYGGEFTNSGVVDPEVATGHILRVIWFTAIEDQDMTGHFELWQGIPDTGTFIAEATVELLNSTEVTTEYTLSAAEANAITDYNDLHFDLWGRGTGGGPARALGVEAIELEIPGVDVGNVVAVGTVAEVNDLIAFQPIKDIIQPVGVLAEINPLVPIAATKVAPVGTLTEANTLIPVDQFKTASIGTMAQLDTLLPVAADKPIITGVGTLAGADTLLPVPADKVAPIGTLAGADTLLPVAADKPIFKSVGTLGETDSLIPAAVEQPGGQEVSVGTLAGADSLLAVQARKVAPIGTITEDDTLLPVAADKPIITGVGTLGELDTLLPIAVDKPIITGVGTLGELDTLLPIEALQPGGGDIGTITELDTLLPVAADKEIITSVGTLGESDSLLPVLARKLAPIGTITEDDTLLPVEAVKQIITPVGTLGEQDALLPIAPEKVIVTPVGTLAETNPLVPVQARKGASIGTLNETNLLIPVGLIQPKFISVGTITEIDTLKPIFVIIATPGPKLTLGKPVALEPSTVDLVVRWLKGNAAVAALVGTNVSSTLPVDDDDITYPWVTVNRLVGVSVFQEAGLDRARISFRVHGGVTSSGAPDWEAADNVIRTINQQIQQTLRVVVTGEGIIRSLSGLEGIQQLVDPDTGGAIWWMDAIIVTQGV